MIRSILFAFGSIVLLACSTSVGPDPQDLEPLGQERDVPSESSGNVPTPYGVVVDTPEASTPNSDPGAETVEVDPMAPPDRPAPFADHCGSTYFIHGEVSSTVLKEFGPHGATLETVFDSDGLVSKVRHLSYDDEGRITLIESDRGNDGRINHIVRFQYADGLLWRTSSDYHADGRFDAHEILEYYPNGLVASEQNTRGDIVDLRRYQYDGDSNRVLTDVYLDGAYFNSVAWSHDEEGRVLRAEQISGDGRRSVSTEWSYEEGLVFERTDGRTIVTHLDAAGNTLREERFLHDDDAPARVLELDYSCFDEEEPSPEL